MLTYHREINFIKNFIVFKIELISQIYVYELSCHKWHTIAHPIIDSRKPHLHHRLQENPAVSATCHLSVSPRVSCLDCEGVMKRCTRMLMSKNIPRMSMTDSIFKTVWNSSLWLSVYEYLQLDALCCWLQLALKPSATLDRLHSPPLLES